MGTKKLVNNNNNINNKIKNNKINVIGAGFAGCEAAWQIAQRGIQVDLYDMKPEKFSPAHKSKNFCELVCSNSFKSNFIDNSSGLLKQEMRLLNSLILECADKTSVPAGGALAVDRDKFSELVTQKIKNHKLINIISQEVIDIDNLNNNINIICTGPLTSDNLAEKIKDLCDNLLSFYDAAAPIVTFESIDMNHAFFGSRYNKNNSSDYLNCPLNKEEYEKFYYELINAERAELHDIDKNNNNLKVYEGCMPVEIMAKRGIDTLRYGPMKPVGLRDENNNKFHAVVQLRKENSEGSLYNIVGFQTNLKFGEQKRVFSLIPALKNLEIVRYGVMHRNTFIDSPRVLNRDYSFKKKNNLFFAGQITGVEGYIESACSGLVAGINAVRKLNSQESVIFEDICMIGALSKYITDETVQNFQPMGANFGIIFPLENIIKDKKIRYNKFAERSLEYIKKLKI